MAEDTSLSEDKSLHQGQQFDNFKDFKAALEDWAISSKFHTRIRASDRTRVIAVCAQKTCPFHVRARLSKKNHRVVIGSLRPSHNCQNGVFTSTRTNGAAVAEGGPPASNTPSRTIAHSQKWLQRVLPGVLTITPTTRPVEIIDAIRAKYAVDLDYTTARKAKTTFLKDNLPEPEPTELTSFQQLPAFLESLKTLNPGTYTHLSTEPNTRRFQRVFVCPSTSANALANCRQIVVLDSDAKGSGQPGLFMKSAFFAQTILMATTVDANNEPLLLAWALVDNEDEHSWRYFVDNLRQALPDLDSSGATVVVDRDNDQLVLAAENGFRKASTIYSIQHLADSMERNFNTTVRKKFEEIAFTGHGDFLKGIAGLKTLQSNNFSAAEYIETIDTSKWAAAYMTSKRFGYNLKTSDVLYSAVINAEAVAESTPGGQGSKPGGTNSTNAAGANSVNGTTNGTPGTAGGANSSSLNELRKLPIHGLLAAIWNTQASIFQKRYKASLIASATPPSDYLTPFARGHVKESLMNSQQRSIQFSHPWLALVFPLPSSSGNLNAPSKEYIVDTMKGTCTCTFFQEYQLPCRHAVGMLMNHGDWNDHPIPSTNRSTSHGMQNGQDEMDHTDGFGNDNMRRGGNAQSGQNKSAAKPIIPHPYSADAWRRTYVLGLGRLQTGIQYPVSSDCAPPAGRPRQTGGTQSTTQPADGNPSVQATPTPAQRQQQQQPPQPPPEPMQTQPQPHIPPQQHSRPPPQASPAQRQIHETPQPQKTQSMGSQHHRSQHQQHPQQHQQQQQQQQQQQSQQQQQQSQQQQSQQLQPSHHHQPQQQQQHPSQSQPQHRSPAQRPLQNPTASHGGGQHQSNHQAHQSSQSSGGYFGSNPAGINNISNSQMGSQQMQPSNSQSSHTSSQPQQPQRHHSQQSYQQQPQQHQPQSHHAQSHHQSQQSRNPQQQQQPHHQQMQQQQQQQHHPHPSQTSPYMQPQNPIHKQPNLPNINTNMQQPGGPGGPGRPTGRPVGAPNQQRTGRQRFEEEAAANRAAANATPSHSSTIHGMGPPNGAQVTPNMRGGRASFVAPPGSFQTPPQHQTSGMSGGPPSHYGNAGMNPSGSMNAGNQGHGNNPGGPGSGGNIQATPSNQAQQAPQSSTPGSGNRTCSKCKAVGHNARTCKAALGVY